MRVVVAGSSGFLGTALRDRLARAGHTVVRLVRGTASTPTESHWDPYAGEVDADVIATADVVINLAGAPIAHWPWTAAYRRTLLTSRTATTGTLARAVARVGGAPALVNGAGVGAYGDRGDEVLTERSSRGDTFLAGVVREWEEATQPAVDAGSRVVTLRSGVVLHPSGGALRLMQVPFRLGVGGRLGSGRQWFSPISLDDWTAAVLWLAEHDNASGPHNLVGLTPVTNAAFTAAMGAVLHRPTVLPVPAAPVRLALGGLAIELLGSMRVQPAHLQAGGFTWQHPDVASMLRAGFGR
ncbi:MAG: TIGR01777 family protein [Nocardioidaceae bacterium]|nr:TIGR01777 family protein [Nocardioidaceae bacterium]